MRTTCNGSIALFIGLRESMAYDKPAMDSHFTKFMIASLKRDKRCGDRGHAVASLCTVSLATTFTIACCVGCCLRIYSATMACCVGCCLSIYSAWLPSLFGVCSESRRRTAFCAACPRSLAWCIIIAHFALHVLLRMLYCCITDQMGQQVSLRCTQCVAWSAWITHRRCSRSMDPREALLEYAQSGADSAPHSGLKT